MASARGLRRKRKQNASKDPKAPGHRKAEAKWVRKNLQRHRAAARAYYHRNKQRVLAQRKVARTSKHRSLIAQRRRKYGGGSVGRPRES